MRGASGSSVCPQRPPRSRQAERRKDALPDAVRSFAGLRIVEGVCPKMSEWPGSGRLLVVNLEGPGTFVSGDRMFTLEAGDLLLLDGHLPLHRATPGRRDIWVHFPRGAGHEQRARQKPAGPCLINGRDGMGTLLRELICALLLTKGPLCHREEEAARDALLDLVDAAYCARRDRCHLQRHEPGIASLGTPEAPWRWRMLVECVEAQLSDPALSPATVAAKRGISTRHLHRLFRQAGMSFGGFVRERRLQRCRDDLADPRFDGLALTEIAYRWGFSDSSHFSRCFRSAFGCTAREFRARQASAWPTTQPTASSRPRSRTRPWPE